MNGRVAAKPQEEPAIEERLPRTEERIEGWFVEYFRPLRHWLSRRAQVPAADLDDLAQDVFLKLLRYPSEEEIRNPLGYLLKTASHRAHEWRELHRVSQPHEPEWLEELFIDDDDETENCIIRDACNAKVQEAVEALPPKPRQALLLRVNEGMTAKEISEKLGRSERMILRDLSKAYNILRAKLRPEDIY